ncbi:2-nitropropane dioxygenase [Pollutimonas subterranea]|uniref:2-nitropropane dioxygenase n=1 Tax=Pollutimonas subterranea TaxID=2045210 RepID=A0A2N4U4D5_9BURK|nr:nitronate monooxygenase [Pollutimonas subterranea]PLC49867.1 2-nitropropane dioxygenase [Pollutimonas subterranea]
MREQVFATRITSLFGIRHPILCGGLQWLADARYVAAVVNAGAMGFMTCMSFPGNPERFRQEIRLCRKLTQGEPFGVSVSIGRRPDIKSVLTPMLDVIIEEEVRFVETSGNNPAWLLDKLKSAGCTVIHKVPAIRYALSAEKLGVDAITVISGEAGGHTGQYMHGQIVQGPLAADALNCPLVLGGGMGDGRHLISTLAMGADAMMLGSRMVVAEEIWAHRDYKEYVASLDESASRVVMSTFGKQHRVLNNATAHDVVKLEMDGILDFEAYQPLVQGSLVQEAYRSGDYSRGLIDMGPAGVFAREIKPVEAIIDEIIDAAVAALAAVNHSAATLRRAGTS